MVKTVGVKDAANTSDDEQRYTQLFKQLDIDADGRINVDDLVKLFDKHKRSYHKESSMTRARKLISLVDSNPDLSANGGGNATNTKGQVISGKSLDFAEFAKYMADHEKKLEVIFKGIDTDNDNQISYQELLRYFKKLKVDVSVNDAKKLVEKINRNGSLVVEPNEWKEYFFLASLDNMDEMLCHWHSAIMELGDGNIVPDDLSPSDRSRSGLWVKNLMAGALAGAVSRTCTAPFDRLRTVMQVLGSRKQIKIVGGFQHMLNEGGFTSLWRGNGMNVLKIAPEGALKFAFYEELKILFNGSNPMRESTIVERFLSGSIAGAMAQSIIYPLEVVKTRMVLRKTGEYSSILDCATKIAKNEGTRAFYKGYLPNILGIIPYAGTDLAVYETLKRFYMSENKSQDNPPIPILLMCGTASTLCGQLISYPLALIRTRLQAQEVPMDSSQRDTMSKLFLRIWRNEGVRGLYRGLLPNIIKVVPAVSISYAVYESAKKSLLNKSSQTDYK